MSKFNEFLEKYLLPIAGKLSTFTILTVLRDAFMLSFPLTIVGSIACVITNLPYLNNLIGDDGVKSLNNTLSILPSTTMSIATLFVVMGIGYYFAKSYEVDAIFASAISVSAFLVLTPLVATNADGTIVSDVIPIVRLGAKGMFVGIIGAFLFTRIYVWAIKKNWTIKMPEGVPPTVAKSFAALIPGCLVFIVALIVRIIFTYTPWGNVHDFIYEIIQMPLTSLGSGLGATLVAIFAIQVLWFFGLHGQIIVNSVLDPIWNTLSLENYEAFNSGTHIPNIITKQFMETFTVGMGGTGMTLAVLVAIFVVAKSSQMREVAKLATPSGIFNVNEPVIFGLPIVMNPTILIPWIISPIVVVTITYIAMKVGIVPLTTGVTVPWTVPIFFSGMLATNSVAGGLMQLFNLVIVFLIWLPFIKGYDKQLLRIEKSIEVKEEMFV
ncbi:PTS cellobiose transporter subunit IIC [Clostridium sp. SHJSY1]|uniref:PTS cellobiose transporter subunit IIC n=1 Tax=Clostridium sp. SHJSY1 TaxID=2942483 RepID=UPI002874BFE8|nr:PTS cellobiose transporter subunit IIC [Clostridium sp. SHJSY1]MDS0526277.1 PTS cellobiose transporter subunit IIC [Clostridium sp. SHJSY1]